jgi:SPP1 family predicted phage head-tail adaptor
MSFDPLYIQPGSLRHDVTIQKPSGTRDVAGQANATWTAVLSTRASIESTSSSAFRFSFQGNALASDATDLVIVRYPGSSIVIKPGMQIVYGDTAYTITAVDDVLRRHRKLALACVGIDVGSV